MKFQTPNYAECTNRKNSLFSLCSTHEIEGLDLKKTAQLLKKGQILFQEGGTPNGLFCLSSGKIVLVKKNTDGKEQIIRIANPGDPIGYRSIVAQSVYSATAVALEDAVVCFIPKDYFHSILHNNPQIEAQLIKILSVALGEAEEKMASMSLKPVRERLAEALLLLSKIYNGDNKNSFFSISREDLGNLVGTAKETAIRLLSEFKEEKIIITQGSKIKILDAKKLLKISHIHD